MEGKIGKNAKGKAKKKMGEKLLTMLSINYSFLVFSD
jgi:hypothetical protein